MFAKYLLLIVTEGCEWSPGKWIELVPLQPSANSEALEQLDIVCR